MPGERRAILSVSDKRGIVDFAKGLVALGYELLATDGTAKILRAERVPVRNVADYTGHPEVLGGRAGEDPPSEDLRGDSCPGGENGRAPEGWGGAHGPRRREPLSVRGDDCEAGREPCRCDREHRYRGRRPHSCRREECEPRNGRRQNIAVPRSARSAPAWRRPRPAAGGPRPRGVRVHERVRGGDVQLPRPL